MLAEAVTVPKVWNIFNGKIVRIEVLHLKEASPSMG
jgi:hypothetical protein